MAGRRVAVVGVAGHWGSRLAARLERDKRIEAVFGLDVRPPDVDLGRTEFLEVDIRSPVLTRLLPSTGVDTVVHSAVVWYPERGKPGRALHDINVIGTLQLLAACERVPTLRALVVRGSAAIYGSEPAAPSFLTEEMARRFPLRTRFQRDIGELEHYVENFARRNAQIACSILRYQPEIGPDLDVPLTRYLAMPAIPVPMGFDARLQLVHAEDATASLLAAVLDPPRGPVNIAPDGMVSLSRIVRMAGRAAVPIPHPLFPSVTVRAGGPLGLGGLGEDAARLLRFGRCLDNSRMRSVLGFEPAFDAVGAVRDHLARSESRAPVRLPSPGAVAAGMARRLVGS